LVFVDAHHSLDTLTLLSSFFSLTASVNNPRFLELNPLIRVLNHDKIKACTFNILVLNSYIDHFLNDLSYVGKNDFYTVDNI
jgi:hypothetical protein